MAKIVPYLTCTLPVAVVAFALSNTSQTAGTPEQRRACEEDAFKFCRSEIPDIPRITACMTKNLKNLSPLCRAQFNK